MNPPHQCGKCRKRWGGLSTCHCAGRCHQTFTGLSAFIAHRKNRQCLSPWEVGLVDAGRAYPCWRLPGDNDHWEKEE